MATSTSGISPNNSLPSWSGIKQFSARTTLSDKVWRVFHCVLFPAAAASGYALAMGLTGAGAPYVLAVCAVALAIRKIVAVAIGYLVCPATSLSKVALKNNKDQGIQELKTWDYVVQDFTLEKSGNAYNALAIRPKTATNGKWQICALGNGMAMELAMDTYSEEGRLNGYNTLLINAPCVGESKGRPTRYQLGAVVESALQFLEQEVKASHIMMRGHSLGGGMIAEAVLNHEFKTDKHRYLVVSDRSFSRLSDAASAMVGRIVRPIFYLAGIELDGVSAAKKLSGLNIHQIIIEHSGNDGIIPGCATLAPKLPDLKKRTLLQSSEIKHNNPLPLTITTKLNELVTEFFKLPAH